MKTIVISSLALLLGIVVPADAMADTADDCIADYENMKAQFEVASPDGEFECVRIANALNLFATGSAPAGCTGEDEWHLEAKSVVGNPGSCSMRILGSAEEGCAFEQVERALAPNEAAAWQNHVTAECRALGSIRGVAAGKGD